MVVINDNFNVKLKDKTFIALGNFDGLHIGHLTLIEKVLEISKENNVKSMVITFANHPLSVVDKTRAPKLIMDKAVKIDILAKMGIEIVDFVTFDEKLMKMSPEEYILNLIKHYNAAGFVVGFNHRFGYKNSGDNELLKKLSRKYGFKLYIVQPVSYKDEVVSSTRIRRAIDNGEIEAANKMLLKPFMLKGSIEHGKMIGRTIGFPTANLKYDKKIILPKNGIYYTIVEYNNKLYRGITNVGTNPTVGLNDITVETNILDFNKDIYDETISIYFINRIRDEIKFNSLEDLKHQLELDKKFALGKNIEI